MKTNVKSILCLACPVPYPSPAPPSSTAVLVAVVDVVSVGSVLLIFVTSVVGVIFGFVCNVPVPHHLPGLPQDILNELYVRLWAPRTLPSPGCLRSRGLHISLVLELLQGWAGQVGQQGGGLAVQRVEPRQFIWQDFNYCIGRYLKPAKIAIYMYVLHIIVLKLYNYLKSFLNHFA